MVYLDLETDIGASEQIYIYTLMMLSSDIPAGQTVGDLATSHVLYLRLH